MLKRTGFLCMLLALFLIFFGCNGSDGMTHSGAGTPGQSSIGTNDDADNANRDGQTATDQNNNASGNLVKDAGNAARNVVDDVGNAIERGVYETGNAVGDKPNDGTRSSSK